jgi:NADH-quinone oxidoreductase subunit N
MRFNRFMSVVDFDLRALSPVLVLCAVVVVGVVFDMETSVRWARATAWVTLLGTLAALGVTLVNGSAYSTLAFGARDAGGTPIPVFTVDAYTTSFTIVFLISTALSVLLSMEYLERFDSQRGEYYVLMLFSVLGMILMAGGNDLILIFLGLELMSLPLYILAGFRRNRESSEASLKYFLLGAFSSGFFLYGIALLYGATGTTNLTAMANAPAISHALFQAGVVLLVVGFGFKVAAVPFHQWAPDVYEGAPTPVAAFFSSAPKAAAFAGIVRVFIATASTQATDWTTLFAVLAALTMTVGNVVALTQKSVKRMLAYSSVAHAGYVLVALAAGASGVQSAVLYLLIYSLMSIGAFGALILAGDAQDERLRFDDFSGLGLRRPTLGVTFSVFLFSLAGFPPMAGFVGKFLIFRDAYEAGRIWLVIVGVLNSVVSAFFYLGVVVRMFMAEPSRAIEPERIGTIARGVLVAALFVALIGLFVGGIAPGSMMNIVRAGTDAATSLAATVGGH